MVLRTDRASQDLVEGHRGTRSRRGLDRHGVVAMGLIIGLLVLWVVLAVIGFVVKSLFWLAIVGIVLFVATGVFGAMRRRAPR
jgi:Flp pilus assembly protein TadB